MKIYLIRHTAVDVPEGMCYGQTDVPLKASFEVESKFVQVKIKDIVPDVVFSSPLSRCCLLTASCGFENPVLDSRLKELNFGDWEGKQWNEIDMSIWKENWINPATPHGESFQEMYQRVSSFFDELKNKNYKSVLVFTHGGVISCARVYFGQTSLGHAFDIKTRYGEVVKFQFEDNM